MTSGRLLHQPSVSGATPEILLLPRFPLPFFSLLILSWGVSSVPAFAQGDGIAALVGADTPRRGVTVVLQSDVELRARILLAGERGGSLPLGRLPPRLLAATLEEMVGEALIAREAERVQVATASVADVAREQRRIEEQGGGEDRLRALQDALGVRDAEIEAIVAQRALVNAFLVANLEGETTVTDAEIESVFASGEHPFLGQQLEDVRDALRVWLGRRAIEAAVERWVAVLRARTRLRLLAPWAPPTDPP